MQFPRARGYQLNITNYFQRRPSAVLGPLADAIPVATTTSDLVPAVRCYAPGAGRADKPIDVEAWAASVPIDADAFEHPPAAATHAENTRQVHALSTGHGAGVAMGSSGDTVFDAASVLFKCCICFDTFVNPVVTLCMHLFCDRCIHRNLQVSSACPQCRGNITTPPMRDGMYEAELERAVEDGVVERPTARARSHAYQWDDIDFPTS
ncbi:hypothetical protein C8R44DRAFT_726934 [Mycena epipterygia]|nr:hypothetical protein C8R44DRAFT_726934 [Mycena epipterygia]